MLLLNLLLKLRIVLLLLLLLQTELIQFVFILHYQILLDLRTFLFEFQLFFLNCLYFVGVAYQALLVYFLPL